MCGELSLYRLFILWFIYDVVIKKYVFEHRIRDIFVYNFKFFNKINGTRTYSESLTVMY